MNDSTDYEQSRTDDSLDELDAKYADHVQRHLAKRKSKGLYTQQSQEPRPTSSGFFSFLRWFKKSEKLNDSGSESCSVPGSPVLVRSQSSSCGSVDSIFSTATAASFAFVSPNAYKPYGGASAPEKCIAPGPDSDTYRRRLKQRDRLRELDKNVTLRKKYRLYSSDTLRNDFNKSPTDKNKKLKTKLMYEEHKDYSDLSLPTVKSVTLNDVALSEEAVRKHRRTVSDSSKDKKAGAYCHVKGKRKAPQPPSVSRCNNYLSAGSLTGSDKTLTRSPTSSCGRKKRPAPAPPPPIGNGEDFRSISSQDIFKYSSEETNRYLSEGAISMDPSGLNNNNKERSKFFEECLSNDSLKLERGVLKSTKESTSYDPAQMSTKENKVKTPLSPVSPRPWYKRTLSGNKENSNAKKDSPKTLDKKKDKINDENLPEVGYSRNSTIFEGGRFSFFSKSQDTDKKKDVEKRKSGVSILANISELDREAAEIVNKEHAREQAMAAAHDDKFYEMPSFLRPRDLNQQVDQDETPKRQSAKELISRFNAITNVTKVTVNTAFFASKDNGNLFSKNGTKKTASYCSSKTIVETSKSREENDTEVKDNDTPPMKRSIFSTAGFKSNPSVTIEDTDKDLGSLAQQRFQANRARRPSSPTISTIVEQSESTTPVNNSTRSSLVFSTNEEVNKLRHVWVCKRCTLENPNWKVKCEVCDMWKPSAKDDNDKIKRPSSPVKHLNTDRKSVNDWEQELKKYFPNRNNKSGLMKSASETSVPKPKVVEVIPKITNANKPDYFIGSCDKKTDKVTVDFSEVEKDVKSLLEMEPNVEEVRKARLARFSANLEEVFNKDSSVTCTDTVNELDEQQKLFAMLKEMKNSLPKRPIPVKLDEKEKKKIEEVKIALAETEKIEQEPKKFGAIKKLFKQKDIKIDKNNDKENKPQVAEAFVITTETIFEDIKVKKENAQNPKPIKVSSSCQTSAIVRKVEPQIQKENGTKEEVILPLSVEEMSTSRLKDGVILATLGNRTYELIKARDFADIKAIKTDKNNTKNMHIYANFPVYENAAQENTKQDGEDNSLKGNNKEVEQLSRELTLPKGIANFKEKLKKASVANTNTLAINRLLRSLETAISEGEHVQAARLAKDLAHLKVTCSVTRHRNSPPSDAVQGATIMVDLYVEDQISHQGPIPIQISSAMTVAKLKEKIAAEFEIPVGLQRWILGNQLASDDDKTLEEHHVTQSGSPVYLYLVAPDGDLEEIDVDASDNIKTNGIDSEELIPGWYYNEEEDTYSFCGSETSSSEETNEQLLDEAAGGGNNSDQEKCFSTLKIGWKCRQCTLINSPLKKNCLICNGDRPDDYKVPKEYLKKNDDAFYLQLVNLDNADIVPNIDPFNCVVCFDNYESGEGVVLRECLHTFCRGCLANIVQFNDEAEVKCPYRDETYACDSILQEREIKAIVTVEVYEHHLAKSIAQAENKIENAFHCKTPNCHGWCIFEDNVNAFKCPVCLHTNCLTCQAIHAGLDCKQYQERMQEDSETNAEARRTKEMLQEMVDRGEAMACPTCQVVLMKKWGCDWLRCSMCRTEICWVTRGPRWGPGGKGDTTGGCKCGVNGVKCHAKCNYCH